MEIERMYGVCDLCGNVVYRLIGAQHGDGRVDSADSPVWLLAGDNLPDDIDVDQLPRIDCGCSD